MKKSGTNNLLIFIFCLISSAGSFAGENDNSIIFKYGILLKSEMTDSRLYALKDGDIVHTDEVIRINYSLIKGNYFYIVWKFPDSTYTLAASYEKNQQNISNSNTIHYTDWLMLDEQTGLETIFLICAHKKLENLEKYLPDQIQKETEQNMKVNEEISRLLGEMESQYSSHSKKGLLTKTASKSDPGGVSFRSEEDPEEESKQQKAVLKKRTSKSDPGGIVFRGDKIMENDLFYESAGVTISITRIHLDHQAGCR